MLPKWKLILTNWINCYFNKDNKKYSPVNLGSLLEIISYLRENLNLDESKSSLLDAHTVQEFMIEKYPDFKFENGVVEPECEENVYLVASLLLFFVCVNSKNVDVKNAMCSKLSPGDQEIIMKFSKHLMECSKITISDVQAAITEACGSDTAVAEPAALQVLVAETPPALRSYHSEVRRLQAALDTEKFDRTYLQEELIRTNMKVEKLLKDKEQYKLEIVNLKSQISMCCGQDKETREDIGCNNTSKLIRQLEELEERLLRTQEELEEAQAEREIYKTKLNQLKSEHEKLLEVSHQETTRANSLAEALEAEYRQTQSLRELVAELQQHNRLNRVDSSLLECDDPDASIHSLQHNSSSCSEVCVNVIEVQLGEERSKNAALNQQIQILQDQLCETSKKAEQEKESFRKIISEKETLILNLKHRVNEEIEEKNTYKAIFDDDVAKLNNELNELEQRLKGSQENSRHIIEKKMLEIKNLQEEKMSLLQSLSDETTKLENIIKDLQCEIDAEKSSKIRLRDEYDNHIMKLNEKVLNRNNELVELQNRILEKGEKIETLQLELKREKELREDMSNKHNNELMHLNSFREQMEQDLQRKSEEAKDLHKHLQQHIVYIEQSNKDSDHLKATIVQLQGDCEILNDTKEKLLVEIKNRDVKAEQIYKETENLKNLLCEEKQKLQYNLEETSATVNALQSQLQNEIQFKVEMQNKLQESYDKISNLSEKNTKLIEDLQKITVVKTENEILINELNANLTEVKKNNEILKQDLTEAYSKLELVSQEVDNNKTVIKNIKDELQNDKKLYHDNMLAKDTLLKSIASKFDSEVVKKITIEEQLNSSRIEKGELLRILSEKDNKILQLQSEYNHISDTLEECKATIQSLDFSLSEKSDEYTQFKNKYNVEVTNLITRLDETEYSLKEVMTKSNNVIEGKELLIQTLTVRSEQIEKSNRELHENLKKIETENQNLIQVISTERSYRSKMEKEYLNQCSTMNNVKSQLNEELHKKDGEIICLEKKNHSLLDTIGEKKDEIKLLEWNLTQMSQKVKDITQQKDKEINVLHKNFIEMEQSTNKIIEGLNKELNTKIQDLAMLEAENSDLCHRIEIDKMNSADILKDKTSLIVDLQKKIENLVKQSDSYEKCLNNDRVIWEKNISEKDNTIKDLTLQIASLNKMIEESKQNEVTISEKDILIQELLEDRTIRKIVNEEKQALLSEKHKIEQLLEKEVFMRTLLSQENECITQQLVEERLGKQLAEKEKENIAHTKKELENNLANATVVKITLEKENIALLAKIENLNQLIATEKSINKELTLEKLKFLEQYNVLDGLKTSISKDKELLELKVTELEAQIKSLKLQFDDDFKKEIEHKHVLEQQVTNLKEENDSLNKQILHDKLDIKKLLDENERLVQESSNLREENKHLLNENENAKTDVTNFNKQVESLISEKYALTNKLQETNDKYSGQLKDKQDEIQGILSDYANFKSEFKKLEKDMAEIKSDLDRSLQNILDVIKQEDTSNVELCEVIEVEKIDKMNLRNKCEYLNRLIDLLTAELIAKRILENKLHKENISLQEIAKHKELHITNLQADILNSRQLIEQFKVDSSKLGEKYNKSLELKTKDIETLQLENQTLHNEVNDVRIQLDCKVHSLKDKLIDNENLTEKLKKTYDCQIENLNMMVNKLTNYLKDKTGELDLIRKEKDKLQHIAEANMELIQSLEEEVKSMKQHEEKILSDFESERLILKNMVTVTESVMEDQKISLSKAISEYLKANEALQKENETFKAEIENTKQITNTIIKEKAYALETALNEISDLKREKTALENNITSQIQFLSAEVLKSKEDIKMKTEEIGRLIEDNQELNKLVLKYKNDISSLEDKNKECKIEKDSAEVEFNAEILKLKKELLDKTEDYNKLDLLLQGHQTTIKSLTDRITDLDKQIEILNFEKTELSTKLEKIETKMQVTAQVEDEEQTKLKRDNQYLLEVVEAQKSEIIKLESLLMYEKQQNKLLQDENNNEKLNLTNKCGILQEYQSKAEQELERRQKEIDMLTVEVKELAGKSDKIMRDRDVLIDTLHQEKDALISKLSKELVEEREKRVQEVELKVEAVNKLSKKLEDVTRSETDTVKILRKENEVLKKTLALKESFAVVSQEKASCKNATQGAVVRDQHQQVDTTPTEHTQSSFESYKTISDLEKILQDRNRTIRSLQSDVTDLKTLIAESENKLLDVSNDLEVSKENCQQLSSQLKKIVHQKNEEIADLKKQLTKMSVTENRASQIIKVSAKYQAIILKRIAEIKSNTVLKELTNFGNTTNCDNDLRRSLNSGSITMEDLENFLDTTDRHLKRFSEKQLALQKERDRLAEVNKINESEIINMRKFLTELSVSIKTFNSVKELYTQKLSRVVSLQRTVRREILGLEGQITDAAMCKLERGYAAVMQDLSECAMNLERWVERIIGRAISAEKIKQAFSSEERPFIATTTIQNASLEVQLEELENSFCKLLEEIARAQKGEGAKDAQAVTVMEVRAEYEDKLNRMKAKMKQLYQEQIGIFKEKQREEIASLEQELQKAREKLDESSRAYEEHIRALTMELWNVGEKFLMKKDEAEWLRRKRSGSLMSLQHVHSSGLVPTQEEPSRPSDTHSLRSLPVTSNTNNKNEGRTLHMSDEEGEVFDNRCLRELSTTPARAPRPRASRDPRDVPPGQRLSELQRRNSLCPPHLKSSYPAEMQFAPALHEEDIKCPGGPNMSLGGRPQRKEVGITAYKKPGPPTPSKQAGRLSATDSELRESLRVETEPNASRKTSTPSRIRALFRSSKPDNEGTPRSRRLSNIFRKK